MQAIFTRSDRFHILRGLYTYFLYITKFIYMKEEVETFQKIYIKVYGVNWSSPPKKSEKGGIFRLYEINSVLVVKTELSIHVWSQNERLDKGWSLKDNICPKIDFLRPEAAKYGKMGNKIIFDSEKRSM